MTLHKEAAHVLNQDDNVDPENSAYEEVTHLLAPLAPKIRVCCKQEVKGSCHQPMNRKQLEHRFDENLFIFAIFLLDFDLVNVFGQHCSQQGTHHCDHRLLHVRHSKDNQFVVRLGSLGHTSKLFVSSVLNDLT